MRREFAWGLLLAMSAVPAAAADPPAAPSVVSFKASVRVDVDASGRPVKVEAPADLPDAIRGYIEGRVASWHYQPARQDGVAVPATTYVSVGACALPDAASGGYRLGVDFKGNGPGLMTESGALMPPEYPREAMRAGATGVYKVVYSVGAAGKARVDAIESMNDASRRYYQAFRMALEKWVAAMPYAPEVVNGQPVSTQVSIPVEFKLDDGGIGEDWRTRYVEEIRSRALQSSECGLAAGTNAGLLPIALDSPVGVTPAPAG